MRSSSVHQRGVVLLFCLIILVVLLAGGVAVVRSMNSTLFSAGNLAFKRDLVNQGEQAIALVLTQVQGSGALTDATTQDLASANYKATRLATNTQGIPTVLMGSDTDFATAGATGNDIVTGPANDVKIRYIIDRLCNTTGVASVSTCVQSVSAPAGGTAFAAGGGAASINTDTVYRLSIRVTGARDTQVFLQASFTKPN